MSSIAIVGVGMMGRTLAEGLLASGEVTAEGLRGTTRRAARAEELSAELGFAVGADNPACVRAASTVLLCTKPHKTPAVVAELAAAGALAHDPLLISIAAGLETAAIEAAAGGAARVVRVMPNTPARIREGMSVVSRGAHATEADEAEALRLFAPLGRVLALEEEHMNTVTGLSASGPAFVYVIIEALSEGGVMMGLPRKVATELAAQAVQGAARMVLATGKHPAELKDEVTTPAGCTISALLALEDGRLRSVLARGVQEAARAAAGLGG